MAEETAPKVVDAPKWAWTVLISLCLTLLLGSVVGSYFLKDTQIRVSQKTAPSVQEEQALAPDTKKMAGEETKGEKFLVFAFLGIVLLGIAFLLKTLQLPGDKLVGGAGAVLLLLGTITAVIFWTWPELGKDKPPTGKAIVSHAAKTPAVLPQLPDNAKFVKALKQGERVYLTRTNMEAPPPKFFAKFKNGVVKAFGNWPAGAPHRFATASVEDYDFYVVLPPGQDLTVSPNDPTLKASTPQRTDADCELDKAFGPK